MKKIVVLASGSGSNFEAIVKKLHGDSCEVALLVCDQPGAYCLKRAETLGIKTLQLTLKDFDSKVRYELEMIKHLKAVNPDLIVLAGYMKLIGETLLAEYEGKIINIHPALLPAFPGRNGVEDALTYGVKVMGVTVHYVDAGIDTGKIIDQESFKRAEDETASESKEKIHAIEHELYPRVIKHLLT
ncbi:MAG: phosphoribosylglycinamide formyltransferase [Defluviitaleaceae bacterium]|nr:phosphoribosylglycinamide formyltransferase [Defluviitaleaceae bacterium]